MATPYRIVLGPQDMGNFHRKTYDPITAAKVSELLQRNLESFDIIFRGARHNHIVHFLLTLYALGATPDEMDKAYDREAAYQRPRFPVDDRVVSAMADSTKLKDYLGQQPQYSNFLLFFQREIEAMEVKETLEKHLFADTEHAARMLPRVFTSIFHGYLHLGFAFEFNQPAIVAEALSMVCVNDAESTKIEPIFARSETLAGGPRQPGQKSLRRLMEEVRGDEILKRSIEGPYVRDRSKNIADNAMTQIVKYTAQYSISDEQLEGRLDEMVDTCSVLLATRPSRIPPGEPHKIDFILFHTVNTLVLMPTLVQHQWISRENAIRLMEWAGRLHLLHYVAETAPPLSTAKLDIYPSLRSWDQVIHLAINHPSDDGHLVKNIRALAWGEQVMSKNYEDARHIMHPGSWLKLANLVVDTVPYDAKASDERWLLHF
ncbi:hypothetical protein H2200_002178 [Cladophialophora chaetospira]|uniref:HypA-like protein n=1 Tax=Cladophialophora chaetospira TaxID=386627 RepID=A0AA38XIE5_9EURO|nr:hypothetical protein H2200_002178 [Cladophialophora chaetospira]